MDDLIYRQAAIDAVHEDFDKVLVWDESGETTADEVEGILDRVPTAEPRKGRWIRWYENGHPRCKCSECITSYGNLDTPFCPNCGADMREKSDGQTG